MHFKRFKRLVMAEAGRPRLGMLAGGGSDAMAIVQTPVAGRQRLGMLTAPAPVVAPVSDEDDLAKLTGIARPSVYQADFFRAVLKGDTNILLNAVAGSGKTSSVVGAAKALRKKGKTDILFLAFNNHIVKELKSRLPQDVKVQTTSSLGYETLRRSFPSVKFELDDLKYRELWRNATRMVGEFREGVMYRDRHEMTVVKIPVAAADFFLRLDKREQSEVKDRLFRTFQLAVMTNTYPADLDALDELVGHHGYYLPFIEHYSAFIVGMLEAGEMMAHKGKIAFLDMLYLPEKWNLQPPTYEVVFGDEVQDWNALQLSLVRKVMRGGGRLYAVGDPYQSIYGWNGADPEAFHKIKEISAGTKEMPLSICYRCPRSVIARAQEIVPHIEAAETAEVGNVADITREEFLRNVEPGDLVLCRTNAPLLATCFKMLAMRIPARVRGSDVAKMLASTIREIGQMTGFTYDQFPSYVEAWGGRVELTLRPDDDRARTELKDLVDSLLAIFAHYPANSVNELAENVTALFGDNLETGVVWLSSVHKAKGLEADRVWILRPDLLPRIHKRQTPQQLAEEMRVRYVALTRAKKEMYFVQKDEGEA
jgi:superfamily I DNA/RNA helicase